MPLFNFFLFFLPLLCILVFYSYTYFYQAQFQLASSVQVQLGTEMSLNISVTPTHPTHPTHPGKYIWVTFSLPRKLKKVEVEGQLAIAIARYNWLATS